jgi:hypothetical protein
MTSRLDVSGMVPTLMIVWVCALIIPLGEAAIAKYRDRPLTRPVLFIASRYFCFGCMFTIFGIAQRANSLGLISYGLYLFTVLMAAMAVGCAGAANRLGAPARD